MRPAEAHLVTVFGSTRNRRRPRRGSAGRSRVGRLSWPFLLGTRKSIRGDSLHRTTLSTRTVGYEVKGHFKDVRDGFSAPQSPPRAHRWHDVGTRRRSITRGLTACMHATRVRGGRSRCGRWGRRLYRAGRGRIEVGGDGAPRLVGLLGVITGILLLAGCPADRVAAGGDHGPATCRCCCSRLRARREQGTGRCSSRADPSEASRARLPGDCRGGPTEERLPPRTTEPASGEQSQAATISTADQEEQACRRANEQPAPSASPSTRRTLRRRAAARAAQQHRPAADPGHRGQH